MKVSEQTKDFFEQVYAIVRLIPEGRVTSYGAIARALGAAKSSRMVGWAMNASHRKAGVPAHRVVNSQGLLTGAAHFIDGPSMQERLEKENIQVKNNKVVDFKSLFWDPQKELKID